MHDPVSILKRIPALKLFIALSLGIILQWHFQVEEKIISRIIIAAISFIVAYFFLGTDLKYRLQVYIGFIIHLLILSTGALLVSQQDIRNNEKWIGKNSFDNAYFIATIEEPIVEKPNSYKAVARFKSILKKDSFRSVKGRLIFYFKKDSGTKSLTYGTQILFKNNLQEIKNSGNPGGFDYKRFSLFKGITHQAYLTPNDFEILPHKDKNFFIEFIYKIRIWVIETLRKNIPGTKEKGLAEALLIGYKDDLDKNLVQAYSNTGVVHIIAISGLHLGIIYWLLIQLTRPIKKRKKLQWFRLLIVVSSLWLFSILAGAQPSVLRAAVMFTFIATSEVLTRRTNIYNTLGLSAFLLLCYNPFWLWDVGFQLSYAAVLSIILFFKPIYNLIFFTNKIVDFFWKLVCVTLAAQIFTLPISIYHFHQMPLLFLLTNIIAVPLATVILIGEILISAIAFVPPAANVLGNIVSKLISFMNWHIERMDKVTFAVWDGLYMNVPQVIFLLLAIGSIAYWLMEKKSFALQLGIVAIVMVLAIRTLQIIEANNQKKIIVYNIPKHQSIDIIDGRQFVYIGDEDVLSNDFLKNFHIKPSRVKHRLTDGVNHPGITQFSFSGVKINIIKHAKQTEGNTKNHSQVIILSGNPRLHIPHLLNMYTPVQFVIDGSVPSWKAKQWQRECDSLKINCHNVAEKGAFVMNVR